MRIKQAWLIVSREFHRFKIALLVGAIVGFAIGLIIVINNTNRALDEAHLESNRHQGQMQIILLEIQKAMSEDKKNTKEINDHLDCILEYFSQERRGGLFIENVQKCRFKRSTTASEPAPRKVASNPSPRTSPAPVPKVNTSPPPGQADRSFLDCSTKERRELLKKELDKETYKRVCK